MRRLDTLIDRIDRDRLSERALELVKIPSPTGQTRTAAERFAAVWRGLRCEVARIDRIPDAPPGTDAPSIAARWKGTGGGPCLQFDGHIDTVPVEHEPPALREGALIGRGAADMKGGLAAIMEAVEVLQEADVRLPGDLLMTTHGLHEAPLGHGEGLRALIAVGHRGDAAVVAEGPAEVLAIAGRGMAIFEATIAGPATSTHENETPPDAPHPLVAAGELILALEQERRRLRGEERPYVGPETLFLGQVHGGDFYNRFPTTCRIEGTRRYFADRRFEDVAAEMRGIAADLARRTGTAIEIAFNRIRDGYRLGEGDKIVQAYLRGYRQATGEELPLGVFRSVGDVSILAGEAGIPAVYCGNRGAGAHGDREVVPIDELVRQVAVLLGIAVSFYELG